MEKKFNNQMVSNVRKQREGHVLRNTGDRNRPFIECLVEEMQRDEFLKRFFDTLEGHVQRIKRAKGVEYERQAREMDELVSKFVQKKAEIVAKLIRSGVQLDENVLGPIYDMGKFELGKGVTDYKRLDYAAFFNGIQLTPEILSNPEDTTFRDNYEKAKAKAEGLDERAEELKRELRRNKIGFGEDRDKRRASLEKELRQVRHDIDAVGHCKRDLERFESLTSEQKALILQYLETNQAIERGVDEINRLLEEFKISIPRETDMVVMNEALNRMSANGMNEQDLLKIFEKLDSIEIRRRRGEFESRSKIDTRRYESAETFVQDVYEIDKLRFEGQGEPDRG